MKSQDGRYSQKIREPENYIVKVSKFVIIPVTHNMCKKVEGLKVMSLNA